MDQLALDPLAIAGMSVAFLLFLCVGALFLMRDPESAPSRAVSRSVWCSVHQQRTTVDFIERVETGLCIRTVERCALRDTREPCNLECCDQAVVEEPPSHAVMTARRLPECA